MYDKRTVITIVIAYYHLSNMHTNLGKIYIFRRRCPYSRQRYLTYHTLFFSLSFFLCVCVAGINSIPRVGVGVGVRGVVLDQTIGLSISRRHDISYPHFRLHRYNTPTTCCNYVCNIPAGRAHTRVLRRSSIDHPSARIRISAHACIHACTHACISLCMDISHW